MSGQKASKQIDRPLLQSFWQQRVVSVSKCFSGDVPSQIPIQLMLIDQQTHQLGNPDRRMRIIQLRSKRFIEVVQAPPLCKCMRIMSCSEQETKKYCCSRRNCFPSTRSSFG